MSTAMRTGRVRPGRASAARRRPVARAGCARRRDPARQLLILAVFLGLWEYTTARNKQAAFLFGSPRRSAASWSRCGSDGSLWRDTWVTGLETMLGFLVGNLLGTVLGLSLVVLALRLAGGRSPSSSRWARSRSSRWRRSSSSGSAPAWPRRSRCRPCRW